MNLLISYSELAEMAAKKSGRTVLFSQVNDNTLRVSTDVKVKIPLLGERLKHFDVDVTVLEMKDGTVFFSLGEGMSLIARGALHFFDELEICEKCGDGFALHLEKVEKLKPVLEKIDVRSIAFGQEGVNMGFDVITI